MSGDYGELREGQRRGALLLILSVAILYAGKTSGLGDALSPMTFLHHNSPSWGETVVELTGDMPGRGIYFLPRGSKVADLLRIAGVTEDELQNMEVPGRALKAGASVTLKEGADGGKQIKVGRMANARRYALGMPIGLNSATAADLMMVQGIGEKTAERILETRAELGRFKAVDDLLEVKGIGEKKLEKFRRSFYVD